MLAPEIKRKVSQRRESVTIQRHFFCYKEKQAAMMPDKKSAFYKAKRGPLSQDALPILFSDQHSDTALSPPFTLYPLLL